MDAVLERGAQLGEADPLAQELAQLAQLAGSDVGLGKQARAQQLGQGACVDGVGLDAGGGDRARAERVGEMELDPLALEQVGQPLPAEGSLERHRRPLRELSERGKQGLRLVDDPAGEQLLAVLVERAELRGLAMQVDPDVHHYWASFR